MSNLRRIHQISLPKITEHTDDVSILDGVTNIDPGLRRLRHNRDKHDSTQSDLREHIKAHYPIEVKPYLCQSEQFNQTRVHFKRLHSKPMRVLAEKLVSVPIIVDGERGHSASDYYERINIMSTLSGRHIYTAPAIVSEYESPNESDGSSSISWVAAVKLHNDALATKLSEPPYNYSNDKISELLSFAQNNHVEVIEVLLLEILNAPITNQP